MKYLIIVLALICVTGCTTIQEGVGKKVELSEEEKNIPIFGIDSGVIKNEVQANIIGKLQALDKYILLGEYVFLKQNSMKDIKGKKILSKAKKIAYEKNADGFIVADLYEKRMNIVVGITGLGWHLKGYTFNYESADLDTLKRHSIMVTKGDQFKIVSGYQAIVAMDYAIKNKIIGLYSIAGKGLTKYSDIKRNSQGTYVNSIYRSLVNRYIDYLRIMAPVYISSGKIDAVKTELSVLKAKESKTKEEIDLVNFLSEIVIRGT